VRRGARACALRSAFAAPLADRALGARREADASADGWAFLENAGGSRVPDCVADAASRYFRNSYVQASTRACFAQP
jgi:selenocysteine lyase/cysteine desulfurase